MAELMLCPVCGRIPGVSKVRPRRWVVACPTLDCSGAPYIVRETEKEAVAAWNKEVMKNDAPRKRH